MRKSKLKTILLILISIMLIFCNCFIFYAPDIERYGGIEDIIYDGHYIVLCRLIDEEDGGWTYLGENRMHDVTGFIAYIINVKTDETYTEYLSTNYGYGLMFWDWPSPSYICKSDKNIYFLSSVLFDNYKYSLQYSMGLEPVYDTMIDQASNLFISPDETEMMIIDYNNILYINHLTNEVREDYGLSDIIDVSWEYGLVAEVSNDNSLRIKYFRQDSVWHEVADTTYSYIYDLRWYRDKLFMKYSGGLAVIEREDSVWVKSRTIEPRYFYMANDSTYIDYEYSDEGIMIYLYDRNDNLLKEYKLENWSL